MTDTHDAWAAILNPDVLRTKLISAGIFLVAHEMLLDSLQRPLRSLYCDEWTAEKGWIMSDKYETAVLALDPTGKKNPIRGSIPWFRKMDAISGDDEIAIKMVTDARNSLAHEMTNMISGSKPPEFAEHFTHLLAWSPR